MACWFCWVKRTSFAGCCFCFVVASWLRICWWFCLVKRTSFAGRSCCVKLAEPAFGALLAPKDAKICVSEGGERGGVGEKLCRDKWLTNGWRKRPRCLSCRRMQSNQSPSKRHLGFLNRHYPNSFGWITAASTRIISMLTTAVG